MGNRNNIKITYHTGDSIYLYGHWIGDEIREIVANAVETSDRVTDESYFARVLFSRMIMNEIESETGYGIAPYAPDQDANNKMVHIDYSTEHDHPQIDYEYEGE